MKKIAFIFLTAVLVAGLGFESAQAAPYISGNVGIASVNDSNIKGGSDSGEMSFDNGFATTGAIGQTIGSAARVEIELGYRANNINKVSLDGPGTATVKGDISTYSLLGNAFYDFATGSRFTPFIGAGIGLANIEADIDLAGREDDNVFAYQLAAGGSMAVGENLNIDLQYRYFGTADPNFNGLDAEYDSHNLMFGLRLFF